MINWITVPITFDINQYNAKPLGKLSVKYPSNIGINHNIILLVDFCLSAIAGVAVVFCIKNVDAPTNNGKNIFVYISADPTMISKFSHKNWPSIGIAWFINGINP